MLAGNRVRKCSSNVLKLAFPASPAEQRCALQRPTNNFIANIINVKERFHRRLLFRWNIPSLFYFFHLFDQKHKRHMFILRALQVQPFTIRHLAFGSGALHYQRAQERQQRAIVFYGCLQAAGQRYTRGRQRRSGAALHAWAAAPQHRGRRGLWIFTEVIHY